MKEWTIRKFQGIVKWEKEYYVLSHLHNDKGYKGYWVRCKWHKEKGWYCITCNQAPPEEIAFVAELAECIHSLDDMG